jgi:hypothetical protein
MRCPHCNLDIPIGQQFCGNCGKRVDVGFDHIRDAVLSDAADRRASLTEKVLLNVIGGLVVLWVGLWLLNGHYEEERFPASRSGSLSLSAPRPQVKTEDRLTLKIEPRDVPVPHVERVGAKGMSWRRDPFKSKLRDASCDSKQSEAVRQAVKKGLDYLSKSQASDGGWSIVGQGGVAANNWGRVGVTGLACLALLGDGHVWGPLGTDERGKEIKSPYGEKTRKGINFLTVQQVTKGPDKGRVGGKAGHPMYNQGFATAALAEAYAMSGEPYLGEAAQWAVNYIISAQQKSGGWDYWEKQGARADTSVTCCQLMGLYSARLAGLKVPDQVFKDGQRWLDSVTDPKTFNVGYDRRWEKSEEGTRFGTTAMGLALQLYLGRSPSAESIRRQARRLLYFRPPEYKASWKPDEKAARMDYYYIYHGTMAFHRLGGDDWRKWNKALIKMLTATQSKSGFWQSRDNPHGKAAGRIYTTAAALLALEVYYRYP